VGFHYLIDALREGGASDLIYEMNARSDVPGYGFQLKKGATALTESWPALEEVSNNHLMLGHIMQWFYDGLGGIGQTEKSLAYQHLMIKPAFLDSVASGTSTYRTPYGTVSSSWKKVNGSWNLHLQLPPNTKTTLSLPTTSMENVKADQQSLTGNKDIRSPHQENGRVIMELASGEYDFSF
jgi:alpha-L-rhamnosidase